MSTVKHNGGLNMTFWGSVHRNLFLKMRHSHVPSDGSLQISCNKQIWKIEDSCARRNECI